MIFTHELRNFRNLFIERKNLDIFLEIFFWGNEFESNEIFTYTLRTFTLLNRSVR